MLPPTSWLKHKSIQTLQQRPFSSMSGESQLLPIILTVRGKITECHLEQRLPRDPPRVCHSSSHESRCISLKASVLFPAVMFSSQRPRQRQLIPLYTLQTHTNTRANRG